MTGAAAAIVEEALLAGRQLLAEAGGPKGSSRGLPCCVNDDTMARSNANVMNERGQTRHKTRSESPFAAN